MKLGRFNVRTLLVAVAVAALFIELVGLGRCSRHYAARARAAASAEQVNRNVARNSRLAALQCVEEAKRSESADPAKAEALRARAERLRRHIPFFEAQKAAIKRVVFDRAVSHPWEGNPPDAEDLAITPMP